MTLKRRQFLKSIAIGGVGVATVGLTACSSTGKDGKKSLSKLGKGKQVQNMSGFAAPKLKTVRIGFIGLGMRGPGAVTRMSHIEGVEIAGLCDKHLDRVEKVQKRLTKKGVAKAKHFSGEDGWKKMCQDPNIDLIYITSPWSLHTPMALMAMEYGKHAAIEVPAATTIDECWQLVETSERTKKHCMMLENCCYDFFELLTLNMARQGYFGEIIHAEGAYLHNLLGLNFNKNGYTDMWRLKENYRNGNIYPTHGLGPVCQIMNVNRGDKMEYLTSMSSNDFHMSNEATKRAEKDDFYKEFVGKEFGGNMNTTTVRTQKGKTIMIQHDVTTPRPYSRIHLVTGTKGMARKWPKSKISKGHGWASDEEIKELYAKYTPEIVNKIGEMAKQVGGHGGMDFMMDWRLIDCLRNGLPLDQDVYDCALWSSIGPLSEESVRNRSNSVDVPDFTRGSWKTNSPIELTLKGGGTTGVKSVKKADSSEQLSV